MDSAKPKITVFKRGQWWVQIQEFLKSSNKDIHYPKECGLDSWHKETGRATNRDFEVVKEQNKVVLERTAVEKKVMKYQYKC